MTDKPNITSFDEAKAALDEEIESTQSIVKLYEGDVERAKSKLAPYEQTLWRLKSIRRRMDPAVKLEAVQSEPEAA